MSEKFKIIGNPETDGSTGIISAMVSIDGRVFAVEADSQNHTLKIRGKVILYEKLSPLLKKIYDVLVGKELEKSTIRDDKQKSENDKFEK